MRDTGGAFGQKVVPLPRGHVPAARGAEGAGGAEVDRGPPREPDGRGPGPARARHGAAWRSTPTARSSAPGSTTSRTSAPTRSPGRSASSAAVGMIFPGPYRMPKATWATTSVFSNTPGRTAYRGPWQFETVAREVLLDIAARRIGIDPVELRRRNLLARDELPYSNPIGMPYDRHDAAGDVRGGAREARLRRRSAASRRRPASEGRLPRRRHEQLRRADGDRHGVLRHRGRDDPRRAVRQGQRVPGRRLGREQPGDDGGAAHRRRARASTSTTCTRSRATPPSRPSAPAPAAAAAARWSPARSPRPAAMLRERIVAIAAHMLEAVARRHRARRQPRHGRGARRRSASPWPRSPTIAYFDPWTMPPGVPPGLEASARYQAQASDDLGQRHPRVHLRGRHRDRRGHAAALHRRRGLRPDDQPERRRGPDRRRHRAGHRRRAARAPRLRRGRQPARHDVRRLPAADHRPRCR